MLMVVEHHLVKAGFRCSTIRGDVPAKKRAELVDAFNNDSRGPEVRKVNNAIPVTVNDIPKDIY